MQPKPVGKKTESFRNRLTQAAMPELLWKPKAWRRILKVIFRLPDYLALRRAKLKMAKAYDLHNVVKQMPSFVPMYIRAVNKRQIMTLDYLQAYGDEILRHFVQNHFRKRYGLNSPQWNDFLARQEVALKRVVQLRRLRQNQFLKEERKNLPPAVRALISGKNPIEAKQILMQYYQMLDEKERRATLSRKEQDALAYKDKYADIIEKAKMIAMFGQLEQEQKKASNSNPTTAALLTYQKRSK